MTGLKNGLILKWRNHEVIKSFKYNENNYTYPLVKTVEDEIIVAACDTLLVLDSNLNLIKRFTPIDGLPYALDATKTYIAYGTYDGKVAFYSRHGSSEPTVSLKMKNLISYVLRYINTRAWLPVSLLSLIK